MLERVWRKGNPATLLWGGGECKFVQSLRRIAWRFLKKLKIELSYNPAIPLVGIYLEKTIIRKDICTPMFIAGLYTIAKTWKQPRCPSTDEWIMKMWYKYTMEYYSNHKKEWNNAICNNMDGPRDYHTKWSHSNRERQIYDIAYMWNLIFKNDTNELIYKTETDLQI